MNCFYCKGVETIEEGTTRFCACDASTPFIVENVPASVCRLCGDKSFSGETVDALEKIKNGEVRPASVRVIEVFDFVKLGQQSDEESHFANIYVSHQTRLSRSLQEARPNILDDLTLWETMVTMVLPTPEYPVAQESVRNPTRHWQGMDKPTSYRVSEPSKLVSRQGR